MSESVGQFWRENSLFLSSFENSPLPQLVLQDSRFVDCNGAAVALFEFSSKNQCFQTTPSLLSPKRQPNGQRSEIAGFGHIETCLKKGSAMFPWQHCTINGGMFNVQVSLTDISPDKNSIHKFIHCVLVPNSESQQVTVSETLSRDEQELISLENYVLLNEYKRAMDLSSIVSKTDAKGNITYVNSRFVEISGFQEHELIGQNHNIVNHPDMDKEVFADLWRTIKSGQVWKGVIRNKRKDGSSYYVDSSIFPIFDAKGRIKEYISLRHDLTELYQQQVIIKHQNTDSLTQLNNLNKLYSDLNLNQHVHIGVFEFSGLADIERAYKRADYERVVCQIASILGQHFSSLNKDTTLYRSGEYQFTVAVPTELMAQGFVIQCEAFSYYLELQHINLDEQNINIPLNIGIVIDGVGEECFRNAQMALLSNKNATNKVTVFSEHNQVLKELNDTITWTSKLKKALSEKSIVAFGQNIINKEGDIHSTEVLMRYWDQQQQKYISPFFFLHHAHKAQIYPALSHSVVKQAFEHFLDKPQRFSINLTYSEILQIDSQFAIYDVLKKYQKLAGRLTIELVESEQIDPQDAAFISALATLKKFGCKLAIDDFGSGYSNFETFINLPIDIIKIDGSLIKNIHQNEKHYLLVKSIVKFAHSLGIEVVAEFVANQDIYNLLKTLDVDYFQGFYFHEPQKLD